MIAALLHNLSTLLVLANAGRLLRFQEPLPRLVPHGPPLSQRHEDQT
jgi:Cd2+/Zn2+-exporting ATPase